MNPLPPQAYTKEVLLKAYSWLQNQTPSIKEMASTPDVLVSLYLKTTRDGEESLERPSITNFKKELKSIASMMGDFEKPASTSQTLVQAPVPAPRVYASKPPSSEMAQLRSDTKQNSLFGASLSQGSSFAAEPAFLPSAPSAFTEAHRSSFALGALDTRSQFMIQEVKELLNLSSDAEALRLLIKLGHQKAKSLSV